MSDPHNRNTRINKFEKRRKNTKAISLLFSLGIILLILLLWMLVFGGKDDKPVDSNTEDQTEDVDETDKDNVAEEKDKQKDDETSNNATDSDEEEKEAEENVGQEDTKIESIEPSDDNVTEAYTGNWAPVKTTQQEPHITNYDSGSQDRTEMEEAIKLATGLGQEDKMVVWWLENGGDQQVVATVSDRNETIVNRVLIKWIEGQGWQPQKVEVLKENDQKWRFE